VKFLKSLKNLTPKTTQKTTRRTTLTTLVAVAVGLSPFFLASCETAQEAPSVLADDLAGSTKSAAKVGLNAEQAQQVGREMSLAFLKKYPLLENEAVTLYLNNVGQYVGKHLDLGGKNIKCANKLDKVLPVKGFRVAAVDADEKVAVGLPGGFIFVSKGLLEGMKSEDELAGILAREATHIVCQDGLNVAAGEVNAKVFEKFFKKKLSRRQGKMADRGALMALYRAGYFPADYIAHMEAAVSAPTPGYTSTMERVNWLKKDYSKMVKKGVVNTQKSRVARFEEFKKTVTQ